LMSSAARSLEILPSLAHEESNTSSRLDVLADWLLRGPLTVILLGFCALLLLGWIPQYLYWPWWIDPSEFCFLAEQWDQGLTLPYRDLLCFNLPGAIYLHWIIGKVAGWGNTRAFYAVDASFVVLLGATLCAWSKRVLGQYLPAVVGYIAFLAYYLDKGYELVGQRDWHASFFAILGLLVIQAWPGRPSRLVSAMLLAVGLSFRPQVILFIPAYLLAIDGVVRRTGESWTLTLRATLEWGLALVVSLGLVFSPLIFTGLWRDFLFGPLGLGLVSPGGNYNNDSVGLRLTKFLKPINLPVITVVAVSALVAVKDPSRRRFYAPWIAAFFLAAVYRPLSPHVDHEYLSHPFYVVRSVFFALAAFAIYRIADMRCLPGLIAIVMLVALAIPTRPTYVGLYGIIYTSAIVQGVEPPFAPPAYLEYNRNRNPAIGHYDWKEYRALLDYLDRSTTPNTRVANLLYHTPAVLGIIRRPSVFPTPALNWPRSDPSFVPLYVKRLEEATDSVVIVSREDETLDNPHFYDFFWPTIEKHYQFEVRFGELEVWRRKPSSANSAAAS
jgi:hypothetical protein